MNGYLNREIASRVLQAGGEKYVQHIGKKNPFFHKVTVVFEKGFKKQKVAIQAKSYASKDGDKNDYDPDVYDIMNPQGSGYTKGETKETFYIGEKEEYDVCTFSFGCFSKEWLEVSAVDASGQVLKNVQVSIAYDGEY